MTGVTEKSKEEAITGLEYCAWAKGVMDGKKVNLSNLTRNLNTRYAEYAPVRVGDNLYYTSYSRPLNGDGSARSDR